MFAEIIFAQSDNGVEFNDVAKELRCPTCTGLSVLDSDAPFSLQIKKTVQDKINEGMPKEDILKFFTERYGPWILRAPPKEGFSYLAWVFPILILSFGPLGVWLILRRRRIPVSAKKVRSREEIIDEMMNLLKEKKNYA